MHLVLVCICFSAFALAGTEVGILPDTNATRTAETKVAEAEATSFWLTATAVTFTPTFTPTDTLTPTDTFTPTDTYTSTDSPEPANTITSTPSETPLRTSTPTRLQSHLLEVDGVEFIRSDRVTESFGSLEIDIQPGYNNAEFAVELYQIALSEKIASFGSGGRFDFNVILWDGQGPAVDYTLDLETDEFRETELSITPEITPIGRIVFVDVASLNIRTGPAASFERIGFAERGDEIVVIREMNGWYQYEFDGQLGWIAAEFTSSSEPATPFPLPPSGGSSGGSSGSQATSPPASQPTSTNICLQYARPSNCATALTYGLNASTIASCWPHLDRDNDGVACYGD